MSDAITTSPYPSQRIRAIRVPRMTDVTAPRPDDLVLAAEFPAVTRQQWQRLVAKVLGDGDGDSPEQAARDHHRGRHRDRAAVRRRCQSAGPGLPGAGAVRARARTGRQPRRMGRPAAA